MSKMDALSDTFFKRRSFWIDEIVKISGHFGQDSSRIEEELSNEVKKEGGTALIDHLRLCGSIPEKYEHDSSEEKLYSKYTDALLSSAFQYIGLSSIVLSERADAADVEAVCNDYSLVGDAKAFRLSRTAKNQKDFKVEAMHRWKRGKPYALVVCPIYQLPSRSSQIYQQAIARTVCVFSYSHLAVIVRLADQVGQQSAMTLLHQTLNSTRELNPDKDASLYWSTINRTMLAFHPCMDKLWQAEKSVTMDCINAAKQEAFLFLAQEREAVMRLSKDEAIKALLKDRNIDGRRAMVQKVGDNALLSVS